MAEYKNDAKQTEISVEKCAVLVVDMLNDFLKEGGVMKMDGAEVIYQPISDLVKAAREYGLPVIYVNDCHRKNKYDSEFDKRPEHCIEGSWGGQVIEELKMEESDYVVRKRRYSGFYQTDLQLVLDELNVKNVIITGVMTNICVRATAHDAFFLGYQVLIPRDCCMASSSREQESTLFDIDYCYGNVVDSGMLLDMMKKKYGRIAS